MSTYYEVAGEPARRDPRLERPRLLYLDDVERSFLLVRLADRGATADAILHNLPPGDYRAAWERPHLMDHITTVVDLLRRQDSDKPLFVHGRIQPRILREGVEGSPFFSRLPIGHPGRNAHAIRRIDTLRMKLVTVLGVPVRRPRIAPR